MTFKYGAELGLYQNCPPRTAKPCRREAYRFVHKDLADERNFLVVCKIDPTRFSPEEMHCNALALSMYVSEETARKKFASLKARNRNIHKRIGSHLAKGDLVEDDGIATAPDADGHFSLYESNTVAWEGRFLIVGDLCGNG